MAKPDKTLDGTASGKTASEATDSVSCMAAAPLKYNGKRYAEGDTVALPQSLYEELKAAGVVNPPEPQAALSEKPVA
jgi:hypothetical protein